MKFLDLPLINWEVVLDFSWTNYCVLIEHQTGAAFQVNNSKLYAPVVTFKDLKEQSPGTNIDLK